MKTENKKQALGYTLLIAYFTGIVGLFALWSQQSWITAEWIVSAATFIFYCSSPAVTQKYMETQ